jgi:regulator of telomere elongation helicase 1
METIPEMSETTDFNKKEPVNNEESYTDDHHIVDLNGYKIKFPFKAYDIQKRYMFGVLKACIKWENALLESPTGTGKTLSLLCASLEWLDKAGNEYDNPESMNTSSFKNVQRKGLRCRPKIIYCSRTHSQLTQVIDELKSTPYHPRTALIASRDHMCIHKEIQMNKGMNLNIACNKAVRGGFNGIICKFKDSVDRYSEAEAKQETWKIQDIEDLHEFGESAGVCPYFLQKERVKRADLILMPYNYLIDEKIRENFEIDYRNAVLIIDEAHNIGGVWEEVASLDITSTKLENIIREVGGLKKSIENSKSPDFIVFYRSGIWKNLCRRW